MWMHDFGLQKGMLVRTTYMLGKKAIPFPDNEDRNPNIFEKLYNPNGAGDNDRLNEIAKELNQINL